MDMAQLQIPIPDDLMEKLKALVILRQTTLKAFVNQVLVKAAKQ